MPTNTAIGTVSTGNVGTAGWANSVAVLNTAVGLYGIGSAFAGAVPGVTAPNFLIQAGQVAPTATAANFSFSFPSAFPNGLLCLMMQPVTSGAYDLVTVLTSSNASTGAGQYWHNNSAATGTVGIVYLAIGF